MHISAFAKRVITSDKYGHITNANIITLIHIRVAYLR